MNFRTELNISEKLNLDPSALIMASGSCFAENISAYFGQLGMQISCNPFGTTYNPISLAQQTKTILANAVYKKSQLNQNQFHYFSYDHDGSFSHSDADLCLAKINTSVSEAHNTIKKADVIIFTLGTAYIYRLPHQNQKFLNVVNNCHKEKAIKFQRDLAKTLEITNYLQTAIDDLLKTNSSLKIILTVSPVRHLRDNFVENQVSKAQLIAACHELKATNVTYFPAYEIMMDDLRDYRFYNADLIHPSAVAVDYISQKFSAYLFNAEGLQYLKDAEKIRKQKAHRPIIPNIENIKKLALQTETYEELHREKYPWSKPIGVK